MGYLIKNASVHVAVICIDTALYRKISSNLNTTDGENPGNYSTTNYGSIVDFISSGKIKETGAICIDIDNFEPHQITAFVSEIRVTEPLISFCLMGEKIFLENLPGYHPAWKNRFQHYYKLHKDLNHVDFSENSKLIRDLFLADAIKRSGLGHYTTTPGAIIRIINRPGGFWTIIAFSLLAAIIGGISGPLFQKFF